MCSLFDKEGYVDQLDSHAGINHNFLFFKSLSLSEPCNVNRYPYSRNVLLMPFNPCNWKSLWSMPGSPALALSNNILANAAVTLWDEWTGGGAGRGRISFWTRPTMPTMYFGFIPRTSRLGLKHILDHTSSPPISPAGLRVTFSGGMWWK